MKQKLMKLLILDLMCGLLVACGSSSGESKAAGPKPLASIWAYSTNSTFEQDNTAVVLNQVSVIQLIHSGDVKCVCDALYSGTEDSGTFSNTNCIGQSDWTDMQCDIYEVSGPYSKTSDTLTLGSAPNELIFK